MKGRSHPRNDVELSPGANASILDVIERVPADRRRFLRAAGGVGTLAALGLPALPALAATGTESVPLPGARAFTSGRSPRIGFDSVPPNLAPLRDLVDVPRGYRVEVLLAWGEPVVAGAPVWNVNAAQSAAVQRLQCGMHHDGGHWFGFGQRDDEDRDDDDRARFGSNARGSSTRGLYAVNHEYTHEEILHGAEGLYTGAAYSAEKVAKSKAAHGVSIVEARRVDGTMRVVQGSKYGRRITADTPMEITGPAAGDAMMRTPADPSGRRVLGTVNNCASGRTPWGTYLTCEENWAGYFGTGGGTSTGNSTAFNATRTDAERRYGLSGTGFTIAGGLPQYGWWRADPRWDIAANRNEPNRFGWVVEIDPFDPVSTPKKRTALGRFAHESAQVVIVPKGRNAGRVVVYMGDDSRGEYIYKFVSDGRLDGRDRKDHGDLLDRGTLYVARFDAGGPVVENGYNAGTGRWLPLVFGQGPLVAPAFRNQADVLIRARQAADALGATRMDRPEWTAVDPSTGTAYCTLTNNNGRGVAGTGQANAPVDAANPRRDNRYGHIIRWLEDGGDPAAATFRWDLFVLAGDRTDPQPEHRGNIVSGTPGDPMNYGAPDGLWFDDDGRLWIQTDQAGDGQGDWANVGSNMMLCADPVTGATRRFLTSPPDCEVTGVDMTPDGRTMFVGIQHPGEGAPPSNPTQSSDWPATQFNAAEPHRFPRGRPRSATLVITRLDGGRIGGAPGGRDDDRNDGRRDRDDR